MDAPNDGRIENLSIRVQVRQSGLTYRQIAKEMGITYTYLSRLMRTELSARNKLRILSAISVLQDRGQVDDRNVSGEKS